MRKDRLLKLADFLETVPRRAFDLSLWVSRRASKPEGKRPGDCGFAGCAIGWAAHTKMFRGLHLENSYLKYYDFDGFEAVDNLFGFKRQLFSSSAEGQYLFDTRTYPRGAVTPKQVAKRIRQFVASDGEMET